MASLPQSVARWLLVCAFALVSSSAGLQWVVLRTQKEAVQQHESRMTIEKISTLVDRYETAGVGEKEAVAQDLSGLARRLPEVAPAEPIASGARRIHALASFGGGAGATDVRMQAELKQEVRELVAQAESLESSALNRASQLQLANVLLLCGAVGVTLLLLLQRSQSLRRS